MLKTIIEKKERKNPESLKGFNVLFFFVLFCFVFFFFFFKLKRLWIELDSGTNK